MCTETATPATPVTRSRSGTGRSQGALGFGLIELLVALALVGIVTTWAVPSFDQMIQRRRIEGLSRRLLNDLHALRTLVLLRGEALRLSLSTSDEPGGGYLIHTGAAGACRCLAGLAQCQPGTQLLVQACLDTGATDLQLRANVASILVDPRQATFSPTGSIDVASPRGGSLRHVVNLLGRARLCVARGQFPGLPAC